MDYKLPNGSGLDIAEQIRSKGSELMKSQGMRENQEAMFMSDGGENVRRVQAYLHPFSEHQASTVAREHLGLHCSSEKHSVNDQADCDVELSVNSAY